MKATELMIGDWVYRTLESKYPVKIDWLKTGEYGYYDNGVPKIACTPLAEPIPLTPEILEKNGWITCQFYSEYTNEDDVQIQWDGSNCKGQSRTWEFSYITVGFVHELQHALRLCGLAELADNFKI